MANINVPKNGLSNFNSFIFERQRNGENFRSIIIRSEAKEILEREVEFMAVEDAVDLAAGDGFKCANGDTIFATKRGLRGTN